MLGEDDELVQYVTSRGLGIIFSISGENSQTELSTLLLEQRFLKKEFLVKHQQEQIFQLIKNCAVLL